MSRPARNLFCLCLFLSVDSDPASRAVRYREIAYRLWRMSLDQRRDVSFEARGCLATIADELEDLAERVEDEIAAD